MTTKVRSSTTKMTWVVDPKTLKPLSSSVYDPYCFSHPEPGVTYIENDDWQTMCNEKVEAELRAALIRSGQ